MKTVVITGSSGFIGSQIAKRFQDDNYRVIKTTREYEKQKKDTIYLDLSNHNSIKDSLKSISYDTIIHFGANIGFNKKYEEIYSENVKATEIISNITYEKNAKIIFASGTIVYDDKLEYVNETSEPKPSNPYGMSKLKAEELIKKSLDHFF